MAAFTVTVTQNIDQLTGKTGGDTYAINGGNLTIDQHSRFGLNNANTSTTAATSMGSITLSATLGGTCTIDGRYVRLIAYTAGSGTLPAMNSLVTQVGASGKLMCVYSSLTALPVTSGTIPATGWLMVKQWNSVEYAAGALTLSGITATSSGASTVGFLEIMGNEASTVNANRLGTFNIYGEWYKLGTTSGAAGQKLQIPNHGTLRHIAGVFIEKTAGQKDYEFYPNAGTATTIGTDAYRGKVVWISNTGLVTIQSASNGYLPISGLEVVVPNVFLCNCTTTARNAVVIPNATVATRYDFTTTGGGVVNIDKANIEWYPSFAQAYSVQLSNCGIVDGMTISECATACNWSKVGVGNNPTTALLMQPLTMGLMFAGGTFTDCVWARVSQAASGAHTIGLTDITGFNFIRNTIRANTIRGNATTYSINGTRMMDCYFEDTVLIQGSATLVTCTNVNMKNTKYADVVSGATLTTYAMYVWSISSNCLNITLDGCTFATTNVHPYTALLSIGAAGCSNIKLRNIGTRSAPLTMGSANICGLVYILGTGAAANNVKIQRVYCSGTRTGIMTGDNSSTKVVEENVFGDYADAADVQAVLNFQRKGIGGTLALTAQTAVYGTHFADYFTSTTVGRLAILMNEPTALTTSQVTLANGSAFTAAGGLYMPVIGMSATFEMPYFALGHTQFTNSALVMAGGTATNYNYNFAIDTGSGFSAMTTANYTSTTLGTALNAVGAIDASKGFKLKLKITTITTNTTAITSVYMATISSTTAQDYQYPLDTATISMVGLISDSIVKAKKVSDGTVLFTGNESGGAISFETEYIGAIKLEARKASTQPYYIPYETQVVSISGQTVTATALQQLDE